MTRDILSIATYSETLILGHVDLSTRVRYSFTLKATGEQFVNRWRYKVYAGRRRKAHLICFSGFSLSKKDALRAVLRKVHFFGF